MTVPGVEVHGRTGGWPRVGWEDSVPGAAESAAESAVESEVEPTPVSRGWHRGTAELSPLSERIGIAFTVIAVLTALFAGYLFGWSNLQGARDQRRLLASYSQNGEFQAFNAIAAPDGALVAVLSIPSLGVHQAVVDGTTSQDLESGPGLMPNTALPGSIGDSVIAARHGTFGGPFGALSSLAAGSQVKVVDYEGTFTYVVTSVRTLANGQSLKIDQTKSAVLTLVTSHSSFPPSGLIVATARLQGKGGAPASSSPAVSSSELSLGGSSAGIWQLFAWAVLLAAAIVLTIVGYRRARLPVLVYVLTTPVLLVTVLFTFENVSRLLPATM